MSVHKVTLTSADEEYAPPTKEIEVAVIGDNVFITVYDGSSDDLKVVRKKEYDVPVLSLHALVTALGAFTSQVTTTQVVKP